MIVMTADDADDWTYAKIIKSAGNPLFDGAALLSVGYFFLSDKHPCVTAEMKDQGDDFMIQTPINWKLHWQHVEQYGIRITGMIS